MSQPFTSTRKARPSRPAGAPRRGGRDPGGRGPQKRDADKAEHEILFQTYFKSVGPRTYASQVKKASNDNHYVVLTEGKRDEKTGEVRKTRLFVYSEDFVAFFKMLQETAHFVKDHPLPEEVKKRRDAFWAKKREEARQAPPASGAPATARPPTPSSAPAGTAAASPATTAVKPPGTIASARDRGPSGPGPRSSPNTGVKARAAIG